MNELTASYDVLIVGGGHGGAAAAAALRQRGFAGTLAILCDEPEPPYERPPLSKDYLSGHKTFDRILIRPDSFWAERGIDVRTNERVIEVDPDARIVSTSEGARIGYRTLIWSAGARARRLTCAGADLRGVHAIRTLADVDRLRAELADIAQVLIVGGGYIGLEAAAVLTKLGKAVTIIEMADRVLKRVAGEPIAAFYEAEHHRHGVTVRLNSVVEGLEGEDGAVCAVRLASGERLKADAVIVGIGVLPNVEPLSEAGALCVDGVRIDSACRTTLADVFAIGDCASHRNAYAGHDFIRLESVQNANDQAAVVAKAICGETPKYDAVPWFWSNQYDLKLQTIGLSTGHDEALVRGDPTTGSFSVIYRKNSRVIALDCVNSTRDYVQGKALVVARHCGNMAELCDSNVPLKMLAPNITT